MSLLLRRDANQCLSSLLPPPSSMYFHESTLGHLHIFFLILQNGWAGFKFLPKRMPSFEIDPFLFSLVLDRFSLPFPLFYRWYSPPPATPLFSFFLSHRPSPPPNPSQKETLSCVFSSFLFLSPFPPMFGIGGLFFFSLPPSFPSLL